MQAFIMMRPIIGLYTTVSAVHKVRAYRVERKQPFLYTDALFTIIPVVALYPIVFPFVAYMDMAEAEKWARDL